MTDDMVNFLIKKPAALNIPDGKCAVMTEWFIIGIQVGFHRMEWSQDATKLAQTKSHQYNIDGSAAAFIILDFQFRGSNVRWLSKFKALQLDDIKIVRITWRFQKNLNND